MKLPRGEVRCSAVMHYLLLLLLLLLRSHQGGKVHHRNPNIYQTFTLCHRRNNQTTSPGWTKPHWQGKGFGGGAEGGGGLWNQLGGT